jgi:dephospho-CoA kinase
VIGVTGGFSCGKTTVSRLLAERADKLIDADAIARELLSRDKAVISGVKRTFGPGVFRGKAVDRLKLRETVFSSDKARVSLERIMHPAIMRKIREGIGSAGRGVVVLDAPLLFEKGLDRLVDLTVAVTAPLKDIVKRAVKRGFKKEEALAIVKAQMSVRNKTRKADLVIVNNGNIEKIKKGVERTWKRMEGR